MDFLELPVEIQEEILARADIPTQKALFATGRRVREAIPIQPYLEEWKAQQMIHNWKQAIRRLYDEAKARNDIVYKLISIPKGNYQPYYITPELAKVIGCLPLFNGQPIASSGLIGLWLLIYLKMNENENETEVLDSTLAELTGLPVGTEIDYRNLFELLLQRHRKEKVDTKNEDLAYLNFYYKTLFRDLLERDDKAENRFLLRHGLIYAC